MSKIAADSEFCGLGPNIHKDPREKSIPVANRNRDVKKTVTVNLIFFFIRPKIAAGISIRRGIVSNERSIGKGLPGVIDCILSIFSSAATGRGVNTLHDQSFSGTDTSPRPKRAGRRLRLPEPENN